VADGAPRSLTAGERAFSRLGRGIVRHPWYPIVFWIIVVAIALPFLGRVGSVTANSATTLPANAPSAEAAAELARQFPGGGSGSASYLVFTGPNVTGPLGQAIVVNVSAAIAGDPTIVDRASVDSVYSSYRDYLEGLTTLATGTIAAGLAATPDLPTAINQSATLLWAPPAAFTATWQGLVAAHPSTPPASWNYPAYNATAPTFAGSSEATAVLAAFYGGAAGSAGGFNGSLDCAADLSTVVACADGAARAGSAQLLPLFAPNATALAVAGAALADLGIENYTTSAAQRVAAGVVLATESGLPAAWILEVWTAFPAGAPTPAEVATWTSAIAFNESVADYPLPIPYGIEHQFVDAAGDATLVVVAYTQDSGYTTSSGAAPIHDDVGRVDAAVAPVLRALDPAGTIGYVQTGPAPLDAEESTDLATSLAIVLPLTIATLVLITMLYFRSPVVPLITFGGLGIALLLGIAGVVLIGTVVTHVDQTALTLENTFVLGVGTDYAIFLVARYREELHKGAAPADAVVTSVTWAGQSIATSGATAIIATLALAFSGVALLSQWGMVLSLAVLIAVLVALTAVPALLVLLGPRTFWPAVGPRLRVQAAAAESAVRNESTYFFRTGRRVARRPMTVIALVLLASVPLVYVAITSTTSFDFYEQLPRGHPAADGLATLGATFGPGYTFPTTALLTFGDPLLNGTVPNIEEFTTLAAITDVYNGTPGVASVSSLIGPFGAPLAAWTGIAGLPPATQLQLRSTFAQFVGIDGRTVVLTVVPASSGLSAAAVSLLGTLRSETASFAAGHPDLAAVAFGGGAATTSDIEANTALATERLAILVSIGLVIVLFLVLRSYLIPLLAVATIGLSIAWAWGVTNLVLGSGLGLPLFYFVPTVMFMLILGLGIDYNIFLLTRVREERLAGRTSVEATVHAVGRTGGIISAAAIILASAFAILTTGQFLLLQAIGFSVATAIVLDATIVRTYLVPAALVRLKDRVWTEVRFGRRPATPP